MARKSAIAGSHEETDAQGAGIVPPVEFLAGVAPLVASWCASSARVIALIQHAELDRAAALASFATSMRDIGTLASGARDTEDLAALISRLQQAWMDLGSARQADIMQAWVGLQDEAARQFQALSVRGGPATADATGSAVPMSPMSSMMEQTRASLAQWTRDWTAIVKTPDVVQ